MSAERAHLRARSAKAKKGRPAERRLGELLRETPKAKGTRGAGRPGKLGGHDVLPPNDAPTLAELGISKMSSSRWQALASIPEPLEEGRMPGAHVRAAVARTSMPRGGARTAEVLEYWLTLDEALPPGGMTT